MAVLNPSNSPSNILVSVPLPQAMPTQPKAPAQPALPQAPKTKQPAPPDPFHSVKGPSVMILPHKMAQAEGSSQKMDRKGKPVKFSKETLEALMKAHDDDPYDQVTRNVLSDYLEENGLHHDYETLPNLQGLIHVGLPVISEASPKTGKIKSEPGLRVKHLSPEQRQYAESLLRYAPPIEDEDENEIPLGQDHGIHDIDHHSLAHIAHDWNRFYNGLPSHLKKEVDRRPTGAAHDLALTQNGHGAGFWKGRWKHGDELTEHAKKIGESDLMPSHSEYLYYRSNDPELKINPVKVKLNTEPNKMDRKGVKRKNARSWKDHYPMINNDIHPGILADFLEEDNHPSAQVVRNNSEDARTAWRGTQGYSWGDSMSTSVQHGLLQFLPSMDRSHFIVRSLLHAPDSKGLPRDSIAHHMIASPDEVHSILSSVEMHDWKPDPRNNFSTPPMQIASYYNLKPSSEKMKMTRKKYSRPFAGDHSAMVNAFVGDPTHPAMKAAFGDFLEEDGHPLASSVVGASRGTFPEGEGPALASVSPSQVARGEVGMYHPDSYHWQSLSSDIPVQHGFFRAQKSKYNSNKILISMGLKHNLGGEDAIHYFHKVVDRPELIDMLHRTVMHNERSAENGESPHLYQGASQAQALLNQLSPPKKKMSREGKPVRMAMADPEIIHPLVRSVKDEQLAHRKMTGELPRPKDQINTPMLVLHDALQEHDDPRHELVGNEIEQLGKGKNNFEPPWGPVSPDLSTFLQRTSPSQPRGIGHQVHHAESRVTDLPDGTGLYTYHYSIAGKPYASISWWSDTEAKKYHCIDYGKHFRLREAADWLMRMNEAIRKSHPDQIPESGIHGTIQEMLDVLHRGERNRKRGLDTYGDDLPDGWDRKGADYDAYLGKAKEKMGRKGKPVRMAMANPEIIHPLARAVKDEQLAHRKMTGEYPRTKDQINTPMLVLQDALQEHDDPRHELVGNEIEQLGKGKNNFEPPWGPISHLSTFLPRTSPSPPRGIGHQSHHAESEVTDLPDGTGLYTHHYSIAGEPYASISWWTYRKEPHSYVDYVDYGKHFRLPEAADWLMRMNEAIRKSHPDQIPESGIHGTIQEMLDVLHRGERNRERGLDTDGNDLPDGWDRKGADYDAYMGKTKEKMGRKGKPKKLNKEHWKTPEFKSWFGDWESSPDNASKVVHNDGSPKVVYHGASRVDRIGDEFKKKRATSGPMSYFTSDPDIASHYSQDKSDTSLETPESYGDWFKVKVGNRSVPLASTWWTLPPEKREKISKMAPRITTDNDLNIIDGGPENKTGIGGYDQNIKEARGNHFTALIEEWLNSGDLINNEKNFLDVLKKSGVDFPVEIHDPNAKHSGVVPAYLSIKSPLMTNAIPDEVFSALDKASRRAKKKYEHGVDPWDKNTKDPRVWMELLKEDIAKGVNSTAWTSIPDWVTNTLKKHGYDGIIDTGGKQGGEEHSVYIPFEPHQIKSAIANKGTYSGSKKKINLARYKAPAGGFVAKTSKLVGGGTFYPGGKMLPKEATESRPKPNKKTQAKKKKKGLVKKVVDSGVGSSGSVAMNRIL